jgi:hypothetical protein
VTRPASLRRGAAAGGSDAGGDWRWNATPPGITVYDGGSLQIGNYPPFVNDGAGGEGPLGRASNGAPRQPASACP